MINGQNLLNSESNSRILLIELILKWKIRSKDSLNGLILGAVISKQITEKNKIDTHINGLSGDPKELYDFCIDLYDNNKKGLLWDNLGNNTNIYNFDEFRAMSSTIIWYLNGWCETSNPKKYLIFGEKYMVKRFKSDFIYFRLFTWLELALIKVIGPLCSDRTQFFKLAYKIDKKNKNR